MHAIEIPALLVCLAAIVIGCVTEYARDVAEYREILDSAVPRLAPPAPGAPLTLRQALALTSQEDERIASSGEDYVQALAERQRLLAVFFPTITLLPSFTIEEQPRGSAAAAPGAAAGQTGAASAAGLTSSSQTASGFRPYRGTWQRTEVPVLAGVNLFRGFTDIENYRGAELTVEQRRLLMLDLQQAVLLEAAQAYYQVLRAERETDVLRNSLRVQKERLREVQQQFANGLAIKLNVAQTQAQVDATRVALLQAESDARNGRSGLGFLIGVQGPVANPLAADFAVPGSLPMETEFERVALERREDVRAAQAAVATARHGVDAAIGEYYPSIGLNAAGFLYREYYADASKWSSILSLNLPIFTGGAIAADVRAAWSRLRQAALRESEIRRTSLRDVQIAHENTVTSARKIVEIADEVRVSQEAYDQAVGAYHNGLAINLDVLQAQDALLTAQLRYSNAEFDHAAAYLTLLRVSGRLSETAAEGNAAANAGEGQR